MRKTTKIWLIIAASLVLIGGIIFMGTMSMIQWDFTKLATVQYETNTYEIEESFDSIFVNTDIADIVFARSDDEKCVIECYEEKNTKHSASVEDGTLVVESPDEKSVLDHIAYIGINIGTPKITVYLPKKEYTSLLIREDTGDVEISKEFTFEKVDISQSTGDVTFGASVSGKIAISGSTGDICIENIAAGSLNFTVTTGDIVVSDVSCDGDVNLKSTTGKSDLTRVTCRNLISTGDTGDISMKDVLAVEKYSIERSTGDVAFENCDATEIFIETDTGDVAGTLLTDKIFVTKTDTGSVTVPDSLAGSKCEIITNTGDIKVDVKP